LKITFNPGSGIVTLGDDSVKQTIQLEGFGGQSSEQVERLFRAANVARLPRGNVAGELMFTAEKSHADYATAVAFFKAQYLMLNGQGDAVMTEGATTLTMANAVLRGVQRASQIGKRWGIRYTFGITTIA
jgi:hypothetical protein